MDIFIYYVETNIDKDIVEDKIEDFLGDKGEVTGSGSGINGGNIDIEIYNGENENILNELKKFLQELQLPHSTYMVIGGKRHKLF